MSFDLPKGAQKWGAKVPFVPTDVDDGEQEVEDVTGLVAEYR